MRAARRVAESGFYHVVTRGNGKQIIFESDEDRAAFVRLLRECTHSEGVSVIAWCLMENHVHVVLLDPDGRLSDVMRTLLTRYANRFNARTGHVGHVFQERFFSETIESDRQLLAAVRYVHLNPEKGGLCAAEKYRWSSYSEYVGNKTAQLTRTDIVLDMLQGTEGFARLIRQPDDAYAYVPRCELLDEDDALTIATDALLAAGLCAPGDVKGLSKPRRNKAIVVLSKLGFSIRRIERMTGVGRGTIAYVLRREREAQGDE